MKISTKFFTGSAVFVGLIAAILVGNTLVFQQIKQTAIDKNKQSTATIKASLEAENALKSEIIALKDVVLFNGDNSEMNQFKTQFMESLDELEILIPDATKISIIRRRHKFLSDMAIQLAQRKPSETYLADSQQYFRAINSFNRDIEFFLKDLIDLAYKQSFLIDLQLERLHKMQKNISFAVIGVILILFIGKFVLIWRPVIKSLQKLQVGTAEIAAGNLDYRLNISTGDEVEDLAQAFNYMGLKLAESRETLLENTELNQINQRLELEINERKQAEEALQKQTSILQLLLDTISDAVVVADDREQFIIFNPAAERMFGSLENNAKSKDWSQQYGLFLPDKVTPFPEKNLPLFRAIQGEESDNIEMFVRHAEVPDGIWAVVSGRPLIDSSISLKAGVIVSRDISDRKQVEEAIRQSEAQLRQQTQQLERTLVELQSTQSQLIQTEKMSSLGQLVAGIAHEINNPVNFINGNIAHTSEYAYELIELIRLYQEELPNPGDIIQEKIEKIDLDFLLDDFPKILISMKMGTNRIREIVLSLRTFSRLDEADMKEVDIHEGIESTLLILQNRLKLNPKRPKIEVIKEYGQLPLVECYAGQLNQVFMNIINNAIDAFDSVNNQGFQPDIQRGPNQIKISTELVGNNQVLVRIADNGSGMTQEVQQKLFDPFFTTKPVGEGTGLGLSISYQIVVQRHSGKLRCVSELSKGTEFWIEIPLHQQKKQVVSPLEMKAIVSSI
ncbi:PAS domain S-box [Cylindrospermum stagnale PCC 7417]|uniref:histidine kinase n=1 Tax=Cylindrospermum stagnale PCC 7417 TaxID=56107 RepID=K9WTA1_9NOST|nr:ATP-binding protein [Cylindrospermum stagnale]AFZ23011.1 PAS domain S-box [Cylindrospermum stagnale PCC 7417]